MPIFFYLNIGVVFFIQRLLLVICFATFSSHFVICSFTDSVFLFVVNPHLRIVLHDFYREWKRGGERNNDVRETLISCLLHMP